MMAPNDRETNDVLGSGAISNPEVGEHRKPSPSWSLTKIVELVRKISLARPAFWELVGESMRHLTRKSR